MSNEKILINVNGVKKYASDFSKETTVDQIIHAMLFTNESKFKSELIKQYGLFEEWQQNERILDGNSKFYKYIKAWKSLPGDQLTQVKFTIKKKHQSNETIQIKQYKYCSLSPQIEKSRIAERLKIKSSYVQKQLNNIISLSNQVHKSQYDECVSINSIPSSAWSSDCDEDDTENLIKYSAKTRNRSVTRKRYAIIKRFNKSRESSLRRISPNLDQIDSNKNQMKESLKRIEYLKNELKEIRTELNLNVRTKEKTVDELKQEITNVDKMILLKSKIIESLELELKNLNNLNFDTTNDLWSTSSSSSIKSTDSGFNSEHFANYLEKRFETLV